MDLKLIVLAGAKQGTQIPLKKDKFIIGRASECTLARAVRQSVGATAPSCAKTTRGMSAIWAAATAPFSTTRPSSRRRPSKVGDELRVGPLHFRVESSVQLPRARKPRSRRRQQPAKAADPDPSHDIKRGKQAPAKHVGEVVERTAKQSTGATSEEDISRWLLGGETDDSLRETQTLSLEETTAMTRMATPQETVSTNGKPPAAAEADSTAESEDTVDEEASEKSGRWNIFKKKGAAKKSPGKLPARPAEASKDSREAAADILREMTRRR